MLRRLVILRCAWVQFPALHELDAVDPSSEEVMGGEAQTQSYLQWHSEFKANLGYETLPSKQKTAYIHWTPLLRLKQRQVTHTKMAAVPQQAHYEGGSIKRGASRWHCLLTSHNVLNYVSLVPAAHFT